MKPDTRTRFAFIETRLYWGDGLTAQELAETFGLARQTAQGIIDGYRNQHPGNIILDRSRKRQIRGESFQPHYIRPGTGVFLDYLRGQAMTAYYMEDEDWSGLPFHDVDHLLRPNLQREPMRIVLSALQEQRTITIDYQAKTVAGVRDFSPHHLIFAGNRYHVRGYCHLKRAFLDFVLSRIVHAEPSTAEWKPSQEDADWNSFVDLHFRPNQQLPAEAQRALLLDFSLDDHGILNIHCRRALAFYVSRELLALDPKYGFSRWSQV